MTNTLTPQSPNALFYPQDADKNVRSSVAAFLRWLDASGKTWLTADLKEYRDYLLASDYKDSTAKKHMERIRGRYKDLLHSNAVRDFIQIQIPPDAPPERIYAITQEVLTRLENNTQYDKRTEIKLPTDIARLDSDFVWLTTAEIDAIFDSIPRDDLIGYRDAAMLGLLASYGLREMEACAVTVADLRETQDSNPGVLVQKGKGLLRAFVRWDELTDYTAFIEDWLQVANIKEGVVLKSFGLNDYNTITGDLSIRQLSQRVNRITRTAPHNFRRSYAKILFNGGRDIAYIRQQLRHAKIDTTLRYLGLLGSEDRR
jgi:site-specific recombinase XerD